MTTAVQIPPCPKCGGERYNLTEPGEPPIIECAGCGAISHEALPAIGADDELLPPPDESDELLPPPDDDEYPRIPPVAEDGSLPADAKCQEASPFSGGTYIACGRKAEAIVFHEKDRRAFYMCAPCADHNVRNRGGVLRTPANAAVNQPLPVRDLVRVAELLPADSPLPLLLKFVPNGALRATADAEASALLALQITDDASCRAMDVGLTRARAHKTAIEQHFQEPTDAAFKLHRSLTSKRGEFLEQIERAIKVGGDRIWQFNKQKEREAAEQRRRDQEEADRLARETAQREVEEARAAGIKDSLLEQLEEQAKTATAPPVNTTVQTPRETLRGTTVVDTWKVRLEGTPASALVLQPEKTAEMSAEERTSVLKLLKAILEGKAPISLIRVDWTTANQRVKAEKGTLAIPGLVPYEAGGTRGKSSRAK
jgi:hypothetical protein